MPELPEVERVARSLAPRIIGRRVVAVRLRRKDICQSCRAGRKVASRPVDLLLNATIARVRRHGKQLAIVAQDGRALCVHLGMSGSLTWRQAPPTASHVHAIWQLSHDDTPAGWMVFRDPRRFGGIWTFGSLPELESSRWSSLGPDALTITAKQLAASLHASHRPIKAALLDQTVLAGVGNIYADEALFLAGIRPQATAATLTTDQVTRLSRAIRQVLRASIGAGGSTFRDFEDAESRPGNYQRSHAVYGRAGKPCTVCGKPLRSSRIAQRSTVYCSLCQGTRAG